MFFEYLKPPWKNNKNSYLFTILVQLSCLLLTYCLHKVFIIVPRNTVHKDFVELLLFREEDEAYSYVDGKSILSYKEVLSKL